MKRAISVVDFATPLGKIAGREPQPMTQKVLPPPHPLELSIAGTNGLCNGIVTFGMAQFPKSMRR